MIAAVDPTPLVSDSDLDEIEIVVLRRLREIAMGDHRSQFHGPGFEYVGSRAWEPGDRLSTIDWAQSSLTNFSPLVVRDFEQPGTSAVVVLADGSRSTLCGTDGVPIAETIAWAIGTLGMSSVFFQDTFGLVSFDRGFTVLASRPPRLGRNQVMSCLDAYQRGAAADPSVAGVGQALAGVLRRTSLVAVVSDFLIEDTETVLAELAHLNAVHDVFLVAVDAGAAFELPAASATWVRLYDVETGRRQIWSRRGVQRLAARARAWQNDVVRQAVDRDLDVVRIGADKMQAVSALTEFMAERRLRKA